MTFDPILWSAVTSVTSIGLLLVTGAYAWLTYRMMRATERHAWEANRPRMLIAARTNQGGQFLLIHIENIGISPAENLRLKLNRPVHRHFGLQERINDLPLFSTGLRSLPPGTPSRFGLGVAFSYLSNESDKTKFPSSFEIGASYEYKGHKIEDLFSIDLNEQYLGSTVERDNVDEFGKKFPDTFLRGMRDVAEAIRELQPNVELNE